MEGLYRISSVKDPTKYNFRPLAQGAGLCYDYQPAPMQTNEVHKD